MANQVPICATDEQSNFWQIMNGDQITWDQKKSCLKDNILKLPGLIRNHDDMVNLFKTLSKDKITLVLDQPNMKSILGIFFSNITITQLEEILIKSNEISTDDKQEKKTIILNNMAPYLNAEAAAHVISKHLNSKNSIKFIERLTPKCINEFTLNQIIVFCSKHGGVAIKPILTRYINNLINQGFLTYATLIQQSMNRNDLFLIAQMKAIAEQQGFAILSKREFTLQEKEQYNAIALIENEGRPERVETDRFNPDVMKNNFKVKVIGHTLGLTGSHHVGFDPTAAANMTRKRFIDINQGEKTSLNFRSIDEVKEEFLIHDCPKNGDYEGVEAVWEGHAFSFHVLREGDITHLIYLNRGQQAFERSDQKDMSTVSVYTFNKGQENDMQSISKQLFDALKTQDRQTISKFITKTLPQYKNNELSKTINKSHQKVGNCSIANANLAWHLTLAGQAMKRTPGLSLESAYLQTKPNYKAMRDQDRANAFATLTQGGERLYERDRDYNMALYLTMYKSFQKDITSPDRHLIDLMINKITDTKETSLIELLKTLTSDYFSNVSQEAKPLTDHYHELKDAEQKLNPNKKELSRYSSAEVQLTWIKKVHDKIVQCNLSSPISNEDKLVLEEVGNLYNKKLDEFFRNNNKTDTRLSYINTAAKQVTLDPQNTDNSKTESRNTIQSCKDFKQAMMKIKDSRLSEESLVSERPSNSNRLSS